MEAKYTNKESTFHNIATLISHKFNHPYTSSSEMLVGMIINIHCDLCRDGCVKSV